MDLADNLGALGVVLDQDHLAEDVTADAKKVLFRKGVQLGLG